MSKLNKDLMKDVQNKIYSLEELLNQIKIWKNHKLKIVFTNGCFDLLHFGHISYLSDAKQLGDILIVGLNSTSSVKNLKGPNRPINDQNTRLYILAALQMVDAVIIFEENTPENLINKIIPDILVKGGDWKLSEIVGSEIVLKNHGKVLSIPFVDGYSTTLIEKKIKQSAL